MVFLDGASAEVLHWSGGVRLLARAQGLREFSIFEAAPPQARKAVFVVSEPVVGRVEETLRAIVEASSLHYCVVVQACHPALLGWARQPGRDWGAEDSSATHRLEEQLLHWMGDVNLTAEVVHLPLGLCSPAPSLLLCPSLAPLLPPTAPDLARVARLWTEEHPGQAPPSDPSCWAALPLPLQVRVRQTAATLHSLLSTLGAKEEIWSVGGLARSLGEQLEAWAPARARRKTATNKVSLILVDRTLDFASCCPGAGATLMARLVDLLPRLPHHHTDLATDLSAMFGAAGGVVPGGLASPGLQVQDRAREAEELEAILYSSEKEALALLHRNLVAGNPKTTNSQPKKFVNASVLAAELKGYEGQVEAVVGSLATVTRAQAAATGLLPEANLRRKKVASVVGQYSAAMARGGGAGLLAEVTELVRGRRAAGLGLQDILHLLLFLHSALDVRDSFHPEEEARLRAVLGEALLRDSAEGGLGEVLDLLVERAGGQVDEVVALGVVDAIWERLEGVRRARSGLTSFHSLIGGDGQARGLLEQLLDQVAHLAPHPGSWHLAPHLTPGTTRHLAYAGVQ